MKKIKVFIFGLLILSLGFGLGTVFLHNQVEFPTQLLHLKLLFLFSFIVSSFYILLLFLGRSKNIIKLIFWGGVIQLSGPLLIIIVDSAIYMQRIADSYGPFYTRLVEWLLGSVFIYFVNLPPQLISSDFWRRWMDGLPPEPYWIYYLGDIAAFQFHVYAGLIVLVWSILILRRNKAVE